MIYNFYSNDVSTITTLQIFLIINLIIFHQGQMMTCHITYQLGYQLHLYIII